MSESNINLKPCPLCGRESSVEELHCGIVNIGCGNSDLADTCGLVLFGGNDDTREEMIEKWNTRKEPTDG